MKNNKIKNMILYLIAIIPLLITAFVYNKLPDRYPTHWNFQGQIDAYGSKSSSLITASLAFIFVIFFQIMPYLDPKRKNYEKFRGAYYTFQLMFVIFMSVLHIFTLSAALGYKLIGVDSGAKLLIAALFIVIGNMMPKLKHNYFIGIRTPWTLANEDVWFTTHRLGGKLWFYGGLVMLILAFIPGMISAILYFGTIIGSSLYMTIYSYFVFRKSQNYAK